MRCETFLKEEEEIKEMEDCLRQTGWLDREMDGVEGGVCSNGMSQPTPHSLSHFSSTSALLCPLVEAPPQSPNPTLPEARHARFRQYY